MRRRYLILAFALAPFLVGAGWYAQFRFAVRQVFGGGANLAIVARPERVEAYRVGPLPEGVDRDAAMLSDYLVVAGPIELPKEIAGEASAALVSPGTYMWDAAKACVPVYGVKLSFIRGSERVDVLVCYECLILRVGRDGQAVGGGNFDYGEAALIKAAKAAFPGDAEIQAL
jgi:hypothetical protein